uniref:EF-hand domain-containing protein n=1 Tax=Labrus bergylta TaxID=56723 RepID=A0A3Q3N6M4_9LABR
MSELESGMIAIIQIFHKYSGHNVHSQTKTRVQLTKMSKILDQFVFPFNCPPQQKIQEKETLDELFADLDQNGDLEIDFKEFITLIAMVTSACHELHPKAT